MTPQEFNEKPPRLTRETTVGRLRVGQWFNWQPAEWYGWARLTRKCSRAFSDWNSDKRKIVTTQRYDLHYDATVANPPGVSYGVPADTVVLIKVNNKQGRRKGNVKGTTRKGAHHPRSDTLAAGSTVVRNAGAAPESEAE